MLSHRAPSAESGDEIASDADKSHDRRSRPEAFRASRLPAVTSGLSTSAFPRRKQLKVYTAAHLKLNMINEEKWVTRRCVSRATDRFGLSRAVRRCAVLSPKPTRAERSRLKMQGAPRRCSTHCSDVRAACKCAHCRLTKRMATTPAHCSLTTSDAQF